MRVALFLQCDAALLVMSVVAVFLRRRPAVAAIVYGGSLVLSALLLAGAFGRLIAGGPSDGLVLPIGLPWVGSHFRIDALSAFFLVVINLGAAAASLYGLGHSRHEQDQQRVLPFFPAFLAGMNLVLLADDAFTFLVVMGVHVARVLGAGDGPSSRGGQRAGGLRLYRHGEPGHDGPAAGVRSAGRSARRLYVRDDAREPRRRAGVAGLCSLWRSSARGRRRAWCRSMSGCRSRIRPRRSCLRADERGDDQGCDLRFRADRLRPARRAGLVVGRCR